MGLIMRLTGSLASNVRDTSLSEPSSSQKLGGGSSLLSGRGGGW